MNDTLRSRLNTAQGVLLIVGLIGLALCAIGAFTSTRQFFISYLFAYLFWLGLALGCFTITMIHHLTGGRWGFPVRRFMEAGFSTLPFMALLFIPILFGLHELYPWARPQDVDEVLLKRMPYMSTQWFIARVAIVFLVWLLIAWFLRKWSLEQDKTTDPRPTRRLLALSGPGIVIFPLTATFAYVDWIMSLEKEWYSTIFAVIVLAGQVLAAYAFVTVLLALFEKQAPLAQVVTSLHYHQLGNLTLAFVLFWTYVSFGQLLIIYSANLPREISWYLHRVAGGWKVVVAALALFHFFLPFFLLLFRLVKRRRGYLTTIATMLFVVNLVYTYWLVAPSFHPTGIQLSWLDFAAPVGVGGVWLATFLWRLKAAPLLPLNDPRLKEELVHG